MLHSDIISAVYNTDIYIFKNSDACTVVDEFCRFGRSFSDVQPNRNIININVMLMIVSTMYIPFEQLSFNKKNSCVVEYYQITSQQ